MIKKAAEPQPLIIMKSENLFPYIPVLGFLFEVWYVLAMQSSSGLL